MRYFIIGLLTFICLGVALAPASLITRFVDPQAPVTLLNARGTVWQGQAEVVANGRGIGSLRWSVHPLALLTLKVSADWQLDQTLAQLYGQATLQQALSVSATGDIQAHAVNEWLDPYDIYLEGHFQVVDVVARIDQNEAFEDLTGTLNWSGGLVRFTLSGMLYERHLPPMVTSLTMHEGQPRAVVVAEGDSTPLMIVQPGIPGYIRIGITKRFTQMLQRPWPGNDPDHTIVVEVEERVL